MTVLPVAPLVLPDGGPVLRDHVLSARYLLPDSWPGYDRVTFAYDCVHLAAERAVVLACPPLVNLWGLVTDGALTLDGRPAILRRRIRRRRYEELWIEAGTTTPDRVALDLPGGRRIETRPSVPDDRFAGRRVLLTQLKDEPFDWIAEWVRLHQRHHGADAVLVFDNNSTGYTSADLDAHLGTLGLAAHAVVPVPFPYGYIRARRLRAKAMFLQTCAFNIARLRFLGQAAGVLRLDIDEVAWSDRGSVFDVAAASWSGYLSLPGTWVYLAPDPTGSGHGGTVRHADHTHGADPPRTCHPKWCVRPDSPAGRQPWENHAIGPVQVSPLFRTRGTGYLHCRMLSTAWRDGRNRTAHAGLSLVDLPRARALWGA
jgi:hypothetical protein